MTVKKLDRAPRHAAGETGQAGEIVKETARPGQTECKPSSRRYERDERNAEANKFVVELAWISRSTRHLHAFNVAKRSKLPLRRTSARARCNHRSTQPGGARPPGRRERLSFHGRG